MKWSDWKVKTGILLIVLALILYTADYIIFKDAKSVLFYIGIDLAFIPLEILILVLVVESAINKKEKEMIMEKLNMVIGAFFSEVGTELLTRMSDFDKNKEDITKNLQIKMDWTENNFLSSAETIKNYEYNIYLEGDQDSICLLNNLKSFLKDKREFLLRLLENPNLLEHDNFTDLLWAVFHLTEELENRDKLNNLPVTDYQHLSLDIKRAYSLLIYEWLEYMEHLMENYPYLFSLALRTNPFDPDAEVEIKE